MRILLTGHEGYLGSLMSPRLTDDGHEVVGLDTGYFRDRLLGPAPAVLPTIRKDIRDVTAADLTGFDAVIHLAALSNDPLGNLAPGITYDINQHASVRLAQAAKLAGVERFLYASTCSVYGVSGGDALVDETAPLAPITPYAISKVRVESAINSLADDNFHPVSLRNATAFGYSPRLRADIVVNNLTGWALLTGEVKVLSDGTPWRPLVHGLDIATAFRMCLTADPSLIHAEAFNVGTEENNLTVAEIAEVVGGVVPGATVNITGETASDNRSYRVDFSKIRDVLDYRAEWSVPAGAAELANSYQRHGLSLETFTTDYVRLAWLERLQDRGELSPDMRWLTPQGG